MRLTLDPLSGGGDMDPCDGFLRQRLGIGHSMAASNGLMLTTDLDVLLTLLVTIQDLKDFGREAGSVSYADIDRDRAGEG